jgi:hypothetical protein
MATTIAQKESSFGGCAYERTSPKHEVLSPETRVLNLVISFEEALKLNVAIDECVRRLNSYNRSTTAGKRAAMNLTIHLHADRIAVNEEQV